MKWLVGLILYIGIAIGNAGALNADLRGNTPRLHQSAREARHTLGMSIFFALMPPAVIVTPFVTGFYYNGWTLDSKPFPCTLDPEIWCDGDLPERQ